MSWVILENKPRKPDLPYSGIKNRLCLMPKELNGLWCEILAQGAFISRVRHST